MSEAQPHTKVRGLFRTTLALGAFLLFFFEPIIGKFVLPYFGGGSAVWSVCLLFFTVLLLLGYLYGYLLSKKGHVFALRVHKRVLYLLCGVVIMEWIYFGAPLFPSNMEALLGGAIDMPAARLILVLTLIAGIPFFLLSTTSTMLQVWSALVDKHADPYRLYSLSNVASLLGLLVFPFVIEPLIPLRILAYFLGAAFLVYVFLYARLTLMVENLLAKTPDTSPRGMQEKIHRALFLKWTGYAAYPACFLVATTTMLTRDISPIPLLWVLPLTLYLVSYAVAWRGAVHRLFVWLALIFGASALYLLTAPPFSLFILGVHIAAFFFISHLFHLALYAERPASAQLAVFYLAIAVGGAVGTTVGVFLIPLVFQYAVEFPILIIAGLYIVLMRFEFFPLLSVRNRRVMVVVPLLLMLAYVGNGEIEKMKSMTFLARNFYGSLYVVEMPDPVTGKELRYVANGETLHGMQFLDQELRGEPTTYFSRTSGMGRGLLELREKRGALSVGVVGLGGGTIAAYCQPDDHFTFYEIDPNMVRVAREQFSYLSGCTAPSIVLGDARLSLVDALHSATPPRYDALIVDAFSGDSIPTHLLTKEAFAIYASLLKDEGSLLMIHASNNYLELATVVIGGGETAGLHGIYVIDLPPNLRPDGVSPTGVTKSRWLVLSKNPDALKSYADTGTSTTVLVVKQSKVWTDDFSNVLSVLQY